jgi:4-amino-4-deoxy-L-arabinose transferase-like glycosyltransferase
MVFTAASFPRRPGIFIVLVVLLLYLPFLNKAFHIDDVIFIDVAEMIGMNPLKADPVDYPDVGVMLKDFLPYDISHPVLIPYLIKIVSTFFGHSEPALHAAFILFPLLAVLGLVLLSRCLLPGAEKTIFLLIIFVLSAPAFLVNSHNVMADVPTTAFILIAIGLFCLSMERQKPGLSYMAGAALTAAVFSSYQALAFVPLVFFYALFRKRLSKHIFFSLCLPPVALLAWFLAVYSHHGIFPLVKSSVHVQGFETSDKVLSGLTPEIIRGKASSFFAHLGSSAFPILLLSVLLGGRYVFTSIVLGVSFLLSLLVAVPFTGYTLAQNLLLAGQISLGTTVLVSITTAAFKEKERERRQRLFFLLSWFYIVFGYCMVVMPFGAARYLLPALPPAFMILLSSPKTDFFASRGARLAAGALITISLLNGLTHAYSDYAYAGTYRTFARESKALAEARSRGARVWYIGMWGFHYYMERAGAKYLTAWSNHPKAGDVVVLPEMAALWRPSGALARRLKPYKAEQFVSSLPVRIFSARSRAGFYHHGWGLLSFAVSKEPDEYIRILRVVR